MVWDLQGVVNKWVSVNKKHVRFPNSGSEQELDQNGDASHHSNLESSGLDDRTSSGGGNNELSQSSRGNKTKLKRASSSKTRLRSLSKGSTSIDEEDPTSSQRSSSETSKSIAAGKDVQSQHESNASVHKSPSHGSSSVSGSKLSAQHSGSAGRSKSSSGTEQMSSRRNGRRHQRSNSQTDLLIAKAAMTGNVPKALPIRHRNSSSLRSQHLFPGSNKADSAIAGTSVHSYNSNASVGSLSVNSAVSGSVRSMHSVGSGSLSLQQINAMPWVNEGYDRAMKKQTKRDGSNRYLNHTYAKHFDNRSMSEVSMSSISESRKQSSRQARLLNHMKEHYPNEYRQYSRSSSTRHLHGNRSRHAAPPSPRHYDSQSGIQPLPSSNTPPLSELSDEPDLKGSNGECLKCIQTISQMRMMNDEIQYLRKYARRNCEFCSDVDSAQVDAEALANEELHESAALKKSSQRMSDASFRHKRQIEQMSRERARWQNDMHLKLSKFSLMCKDLNEESAVVKEDLSNTRAELFSAKSERDYLATKVESMQAEIKQYEFVAEENLALRKKIEELEKPVIELGKESREKDLIISELASKLSAATGLIEHMTATVSENSDIDSKDDPISF
eukprot:CAMPEP_0116056418 /NCGR_PEP_ID=MMETSP0322-20121206/4010_1 /TAXON_ID=163516 /ORGANISM="Leptocylindrus danicus var. apora, Strain B651" /LENGTH=613 /DNA_ID=CAMNT_0003540247 /DNA_START=626 /DNA_END=2470 /DNA_ORIENTATION=-